MRMKNYTYQKFLLEGSGNSCEKPVQTAVDHPEWIQAYGVKWKILDYFGRYERKIKLSEIDDNIDVKEDMDCFLKSLKGLEHLYIIYDDAYPTGNPIIDEYRKETACAYEGFLSAAGVNVSFLKPSVYS